MSLDSITSRLQKVYFNQQNIQPYFFVQIIVGLFEMLESLSKYFVEKSNSKPVCVLTRITGLRICNIHNNPNPVSIQPYNFTCTLDCMSQHQGVTEPYPILLILSPCRILLPPAKTYNPFDLSKTTNQTPRNCRRGDPVLSSSFSHNCQWCV